MSKRDFFSLAYVAWRKSVFRRDGGKCQMPGCKYRGKKRNAHHIKTWAKFPTLRFLVSNGITLCPKCHKKVTGKEPIYEATFMMILKNRDM